MSRDGCAAYAANAIGNNPALGLVLRVKSAVAVMPFSRHTQEEEVLLAPGGIPLTHLETIALGPSVFVKGVTFVKMENAAWEKHSLWFHCLVCEEMPRFNHLTSKKHYNAIQNFARGRCLLVKWFGTTLEVCKNCENSKSRLPNMMFEFTGETNFEIHSF